MATRQINDTIHRSRDFLYASQAAPEIYTIFCMISLYWGQELLVNSFHTIPGGKGFAMHKDDHHTWLWMLYGEKEFTIKATKITLSESGDRSFFIPYRVAHGNTYNPGDTTCSHISFGLR